MLMCLKHWRMVPKLYQDAVWTAYRAAPNPGRARNAAYLSACANAVESVAEQEGKPKNNSYRRMIDK